MQTVGRKRGRRRYHRIVIAFDKSHRTADVDVAGIIRHLQFNGNLQSSISAGECDAGAKGANLVSPYGKTHPPAVVVAPVVKRYSGHRSRSASQGYLDAFADRHRRRVIDDGHQQRVPGNIAAGISNLINGPKRALRNIDRRRQHTTIAIDSAALRKDSHLHRRVTVVLSINGGQTQPCNCTACQSAPASPARLSDQSQARHHRAAG